MNINDVMVKAFMDELDKLGMAAKMKIKPKVKAKVTAAPWHAPATDWAAKNPGKAGAIVGGAGALATRKLLD